MNPDEPDNYGGDRDRMTQSRQVKGSTGSSGWDLVIVLMIHSVQNFTNPPIKNVGDQDS